MKDKYVENKMLDLILACPGFGYASKSTVYVDGPDQWTCGHWEGSPECKCQGYFYTVQHWDDVQVFSSFDDAVEFIEEREAEVKQ